MEAGVCGLKMANALLAVVEVKQPGPGNVTTQRRNRTENLVPDQIMKSTIAAKYLAQVYKPANAN